MTATRSTPIRGRRRAARDNAAETAWMGQGACLSRGELPWTADPEHITAPELHVMGAICQDCPVLKQCAGYTKEQRVSAGFWAGSHRDPHAVSLAGPGWAPEPLPGLGSLGGAA